jgi:hypothetical protein
MGPSRAWLRVGSGRAGQVEGVVLVGPGSRSGRAWLRAGGERERVRDRTGDAGTAYGGHVPGIPAGWWAGVKIILDSAQDLPKTVQTNFEVNCKR